jgi:hypothetical protein
VKFTREELQKIRFGLGIAQAWQDQKIEKGEGSCIPKSYLCKVIGKIDDHLNYSDMGWFWNIKRLIKNRLKLK